MMFREFATRFAPSPTGPLHLGHAFSALFSHDMARSCGGRFVLRIEDIDATRSRQEWEDAIYTDLTWLDITWDGVLRQSDRSNNYLSALRELWDMGVLFECRCNRRDIQAALSAPQEGAPLMGPDGLVYPGTCRTTGPIGDFSTGSVLRLNMRAACEHVANQMPLFFEETGHPDHLDKPVAVSSDWLIKHVGDVVLSRRDFLGSYHLSVVLDDAAQNISHVVRGRDLFEATSVHRLVQALLGFDTPVYHHHDLIRDSRGRRLAKRDNAKSIGLLRDAGATVSDIRLLVGLD
jgi:glutamyl-Q tRNA(Asp) synthetase